MLALVIGFFGLLSFQEQPQGSDAKVRADSIRRDVGTSTDTVGHFVQINRIFIIGNRITRDQIVLRELSLKQGDVVWSTDLASTIEMDRKKLINTRLFNKVELKTLELEPGKVDLLIDVDERWYTFPAPLFELSDRNFNEWWQNYNHDFHRVNYGLRLYQYNMRGRNETLRFLAQFGFQRRFELLYRFPFIDKKQKHGLAVEFRFNEPKNIAFQTVGHKYAFLTSDNVLRRDRIGGLTYTYRKSFYKTHTFKIEFVNSFVKDTVRLLNPNYFSGEASESQRYAWIGYGFNADHRDIQAYPLKGYQLGAGIAKFGLTSAEDVDKFEVNFLYSKYADLGKNFYLSNHVNLHWSTPDAVPYTNLSVLGLRRQFVRGYELYVIEGPYYGLAKTTFKKLIFSRNYHWSDMPLEQFRHIPLAIYLKTYADFAYVANYDYYERRDFNTRLSDKLLSGVGLGFDVVSAYDIVLRFEYSFNGEGEKGFFFHVKREF